MMVMVLIMSLTHIISMHLRVSSDFLNGRINHNHLVFSKFFQDTKGELEKN